MYVPRKEIAAYLPAEIPTKKTESWKQGILPAFPPYIFTIKVRAASAYVKGYFKVKAYGAI
jgi:hypothetical protein